MIPGCRCRTGSHRWASSSRTPRAAWSTGTVAASTTTKGASAAATTAGAGSRAGSSSAAGSAVRCCSPDASPSSSSSTKRRRSPPGTGHALCAGGRTTSASRSSGPSCTRARSARTRSTAQLHAERVEPGTRAQLHHEAALDELPDGSFVVHDGAPQLVLGAHVLAWSPAGYVSREPRPSGRATVITPPSLVAVLRKGWEERLVPLLHPSAALAEASGGPRRGGPAEARIVRS